MLLFAAHLVIIATLFKQSDAFPTGAGACTAGNTAVEGSHLINPTTGSLADGGFTISLGGTPLLDGAAGSFSINTDIELILSGGTFKGFLFRLGETGVDTNSAFTVTGPLIQIAPVCTEVGGVTHTSNSDKTTISATLNMAAVAADMPLDVTVVVQNGGGGSEYYYSQFLLSSEGAVAAPVTFAPVPPPTGFPTAIPPTAFPTVALPAPVADTLAPADPPIGGTSAPISGVTDVPVTSAPAGEVTAAPVTSAPVGGATAAPVTSAPVGGATAAPVTSAPVGGATAPPVTSAPVGGATSAPVTLAPVTSAPVSGKGKTSSGKGMSMGEKKGKKEKKDKSSKGKGGGKEDKLKKSTKRFRGRLLV
jgi:hypothetical protein